MSFAYSSLKPTPSESKLDDSKLNQIEFRKKYSADFKEKYEGNGTRTVDGIQLDPLVDQVLNPTYRVKILYANGTNKELGMQVEELNRVLRYYWEKLNPGQKDGNPMCDPSKYPIGHGCCLVM
jgi:hypothetical protein